MHYIASKKLHRNKRTNKIRKVIHQSAEKQHYACSLNSLLLSIRISIHENAISTLHRLMSWESHKEMNVIYINVF